MPMIPETLPDILWVWSEGWGSWVGNRSCNWFVEISHLVRLPKSPCPFECTSRAPPRAWGACAAERSKWCKAVSVNIVYLSSDNFFFFCKSNVSQPAVGKLSLSPSVSPSSQNLAATGRCWALELTVFLPLLPSFSQIPSQSWWPESRVVPPSPWPLSLLSNSFVHLTTFTVYFPRPGPFGTALLLISAIWPQFPTLPLLRIFIPRPLLFHAVERPTLLSPSASHLQQPFHDLHLFTLAA